jgi:hypothetical protein
LNSRNQNKSLFFLWEGLGRMGGFSHVFKQFRLPFFSPYFVSYMHTRKNLPNLPIPSRTPASQALLQSLTFPFMGSWEGFCGAQRRATPPNLPTAAKPGPKIGACPSPGKAKLA